MQKNDMAVVKIMDMGVKGSESRTVIPCSSKML